jgi:hypothetical protein
MIKVPIPEDSQMPIAHSELSNQDKERIKGAHLSEATETLAKTMFISGVRGALKSVAMQMEQKWMKNKLGKARI